jgi:hypothetical protein
VSPIIRATTRQGVEGLSVWHNPFFHLPHELAQFKAPWKHLQTKFLDNLSDSSGAMFSANALENYPTKENGVTWHHDHTTITIRYKDKSKRVVKTTDHLSS